MGEISGSVGIMLRLLVGVELITKSADEKNQKLESIMCVACNLSYLHKYQQKCMSSA